MWNQLALSPREPQLETLLRSCQTARDTEFGRAHRLGEVRSVQDFQARVPLRRYAEFEPYTYRMRHGEPNVLWPGKLKYFGQSSGTSHTAAKDKYLPISSEQIRFQQKCGFDMLARYLDLSGDTDYLSGFALGLYPRSALSSPVPGILQGTNPGIMLRHHPWVASLALIPKPDISDIADFEEKISVMARSFLHYDVRSLSGTTSWFSIFFDRVLAEAKKAGLPHERIDQIWPGLRVLYGGGIAARPYLKLIEERMGRPIPLIENYNATEGGFFAITDSLTEPGMLMVPDRGVFYEFVPMEREQEANPPRVPLWDVQPGVVYSVALTNSSGLFGYLIGDYVKFLSVLPHRMEFAGRTSGVLSITQELTTSLEIERAMEATLRKQTGCRLAEYAVGAEVGVNGQGKGRYVVYGEFTEAPSDLVAFARDFDECMKAENRVYRVNRQHETAILPPRLELLRPGTAARLMEALGFRSFQNKFPRILDERKTAILRTL